MIINKLKNNILWFGSNADLAPKKTEILTQGLKFLDTEVRSNFREHNLKYQKVLHQLRSKEVRDDILFEHIKNAKNNPNSYIDSSNIHDKYMEKYIQYKHHIPQLQQLSDEQIRFGYQQQKEMWVQLLNNSYTPKGNYRDNYLSHVVQRTGPEGEHVLEDRLFKGLREHYFNNPKTLRLSLTMNAKFSPDY